MDKVRKTARYFYKHRFIRYLFVGGTTFVIDFALLFFLHDTLSTTITFATSAAYWISIVYNFLINRHWTFDANEKANLKRHITTYFILLVGNYFFSVIFIAIASSFMYFMLAKVLAVAIQMTWTYYLYKNYIFTKTKKDDSPTIES
jgi:putative flippase GtrA